MSIESLESANEDFMTEQEILDWAPKGATHYTEWMDYYWASLGDAYARFCTNGDIEPFNSVPLARKLSDIQTMVDQKKQIDHLFEQVNEYAEKLADIRERLSTYNFLSVDEMIAAYEQQMRKIAEVSK